MTRNRDSHYSPPVMSGWQHQGAFVVRFNAGTDAETELFQGHVEHVASGKRVHFSSREELLECMAETLKQVKRQLQPANRSHEPMKTGSTNIV